MAFGITCPGCDTTLNVVESLIGKTIKCKTCGEMIPVKAPSRPVVAKALPKQPVAAKVDDEEDDEMDSPLVRAANRFRDDDENDAPKKGSKVPMIAGLVIGALVLFGGGLGMAYVMFGKSSDPQPVAQNNLSSSNQANLDVGKKPEPDKTPEVKPNDPVKDDKKDEIKPDPVTKPSTDKNPPATTVTEKPKPSPTPAIDTNSSAQSSEDRYRKMMSGELDPITLMQCKKATVFIDVETKFGLNGQGSGWFGIEPNIVITNAHVIGMKAPSSPPPAKITIYVNSGEHGQTPGIMQKEIPHQRIKILAVDREHDIAILEILGEPNLPIPFKVRPTSKVRERQGITVFGFPLGYQPGQVTGTKKQPSVSVRPSTATALRYDDYGILRNLQVEGGVNQGNSGGPQTDAEGYVIGMTVSGATHDGVLTQVCFSVPTEHIQGILAGMVEKVFIETAYMSNGNVNIPIRITAQDPLKRLKSIGIGYWIGETSGGIRPPGEIRKGISVADKEYKEVTLKYDSATKTATGLLTFPPLAPGQSYWVQPFYSNAIIPKYYLPGVKVEMKGPPVDLVATNLQVNLKTGQTRPFTMVRSSAQDEFAEGEGTDEEERVKFVTTVKGTETVLAADSTDQLNAARLRLRYDDADIKVDVMNREHQIMPPRVLEQFKAGIKTLESFAYVNRQGGIYKTRTSTFAAKDPLILLLGPAISSDVLGSLTECSIPLPNKDVQPNEDWNSSRTVQLSLSFLDNVRQSSSGGRPSPGSRPRPGGGGTPSTGAQGSEFARRVFTYSQEVKFTYQGSRLRGGRKEAVIKVDGKIVPAAGKGDKSASGYTKGYAYVDVSSGIVVDAEIESEFELDTSIQGLKQRSYSLNKYNLTRGGAVK
ncbi:MAG: trypsin-like peptidase domain-containing protein [Gemmataceae bacterium]